MSYEQMALKAIVKYVNNREIQRLILEEQEHELTNQQGYDERNIRAKLKWKSIISKFKQYKKAEFIRLNSAPTGIWIRLNREYKGLIAIERGNIYYILCKELSAQKPTLNSNYSNTNINV